MKIKITTRSLLLLREIIIRFQDDERYNEVLNGAIYEVSDLFEEKNPNKYTNAFLNLFDNLSRIVLDSKDPIYNYRVACDIEYADRKKHEEVVLEAKNPKFSFLFALNVPGADKKAHEQVIIESGNPEYAYRFALNEKSSDKKALEEVVLKSGNPRWCYLFARNIEGASVGKLRNVTSHYGNEKDNYAFFGEEKNRIDELARINRAVINKGEKGKLLYKLDPVVE